MFDIVCSRNFNELFIFSTFELESHVCYKLFYYSPFKYVDIAINNWTNDVYECFKGFNYLSKAVVDINLISQSLTL